MRREQRRQSPWASADNDYTYATNRQYHLLRRPEKASNVIEIRGDSKAGTAQIADSQSVFKRISSERPFGQLTTQNCLYATFLSRQQSRVHCTSFRQVMQLSASGDM